MIQQKTIGQLITIASLAAIALLTLTPNFGAQPPGVSLCVVCGSYGGTDIVLNVLLFVPLGIGLRLAGVRAGYAVALAAATSLAIELLQIRIVVGRDSSLGDLVSNSIGGWTGVQLTAGWRSLVLPDARRARHRALAAACLWLLMLAGTAWAVRPSLSHLMYWGHWASMSGPGPLFGGRVIRASVGRAILPWDPIANSGALRRALLHGHQPLRAVVLPGAPTDGLAPITRISDIQRNELIMLGQSGRDLVFRMRTHASDLRLRDPAVRITEVFPSAGAAASAPHSAEDTMRIAGAFTGQAYRVWTTAAGRTTSRELRLGPGLGWSFLIPFSYAAGGIASLFTALWLGVLFLPIAYWAARAAADIRPRRAARQRPAAPLAWPTLTMLVGLATPVALGLGLVPLVFHEAPVHWSAWVACAGAAAAGWGLGRMSSAADDEEGAADAACAAQPQQRIAAD